MVNLVDLFGQYQKRDTMDLLFGNEPWKFLFGNQQKHHQRVQVLVLKSRLNRGPNGKLHDPKTLEDCPIRKLHLRDGSHLRATEIPQWDPQSILKSPQNRSVMFSTYTRKLSNEVNYLICPWTLCWNHNIQPTSHQPLYHPWHPIWPCYPIFEP
jgi:hypothetical protein